MIFIVSSPKRGGIDPDALVIPEGYGMPKISYMFDNDAALEEIPIRIIGKPTSASYAFQGFNSLKRLPDIDYSECKAYQYFVDSCYDLEEIDLSSADPSKLVNAAWIYGFGTTAVQRIVNMPLNENVTIATAYNQCFSGCQSLTDISFNGKFGSSVNFSACPFSSASPLLNIAYALSENNVGTVTFKSGTAVSTIMSNAHCRLNSAGDGLETCNAGDEGDLGTISQYITGKGWTVTFV